MYIPKVFKCVMPVGLTEITSNLGNNMKYAISQIASKTFLSVYTTNDDGEFREGYSANILSCDLPQIYKDSKQEGASLTTVFKNCGNRNAIHEIAGLINEDGQNHVILNQAATVSQNDTATVLDELYEVMDTRLSSNGTISYLGLEDCSPETANNALQQFKDYLISLIPTTTTTTTTTTTESPIDKGWDIKNHLNITSNDAYEAGKKFLHMLGVSVPDTTTPPTTAGTPNDDTNDGGYTAAYIITTLAGGIVLGGLLGYGIKRGIDWYKGKNKINHDEENLLLETSNNTYQIKKFIPTLIQSLKELSKSEERYEEIEDNTNSELNYDLLVKLLEKFNNTLKNTPDILQILNELKGIINQQHELSSNISQQILHTLQDTLQHDSKSPIITSSDSPMHTSGDHGLNNFSNSGHDTHTSDEMVSLGNVADSH
ncbi:MULTISPECIES: DUF5460 family protein [unclassified Rickettsia]|uniref:DUF5460 family protein n=1 Tax=unclassified Rickettsia TaxID=114295 RepID=UPI0031331DB0